MITNDEIEFYLRNQPENLTPPEPKEQQDEQCDFCKQYFEPDTLNTYQIFRICDECLECETNEIE